MYDWSTIVTVFLFMVLLMGAASYGGMMFAKWQSRETAKEIQRGFDAIRQRLKGHL